MLNDYESNIQVQPYLKGGDLTNCDVPYVGHNFDRCIILVMTMY